MGFLIVKDRYDRVIKRKRIPGPTRIEYIDQPHISVPKTFEMTFKHAPLSAPRNAKIIFRRRIKGIGDMVSLMSAVRTLKHLRPDLRVVVWAKEPYSEIAELCPDVDEVVTADDYQPDGLLINCDDPCPCGVYESHVEKINLSRPQIFCLAAGLPWLKLKPRLKPDYSALQGMELMRQLRDRPRPWIGVVLRSAERWKDWPHTKEFIRRLSKELGKQGTVIAIDKKLSIRGENVCNTRGLSVKQLVALIDMLDLLITPDTGPLHIAEALEINTIALFGSMDCEVRRRTYASTTVRYIQGRCPLNRQPCWYDVCQPKWAYQPCMQSIEVKQVLQLVKEVLHEA